MGTCGRILLRLRPLNLQILKGLFVSPEEVVSLPSAEVFPHLPPDTLPFPSLTTEINVLLSTKPAVIFSERDARQDNTDIPWAYQ